MQSAVNHLIPELRGSMVDTINDKEAERWKSEGILYATNQKFEEAVRYFEKAS